MAATEYYVTLGGQSLMDVAVEVYGAAEGVVWLLIDNRLPERIYFNQSLERYFAFDRPGWEWTGLLDELTTARLNYGPAWVPPANTHLLVRSEAINATTRDYLTTYGRIVTAL